MTGSGRVGVGLVGAGNISTEYLRNLTSFPDLDVRFVADLDVARARAQATAFGVERAGSPAELLRDETVELVVNLTVPAAHAEVDLSALEAGRHVWSEKPIALDRAAGRRILGAADAAGRRIAGAPDTFLGTGLQAARRYLESGAIGPARTALTLLQSPGPESWHPNPAFLFDVGAGPLFDVGPYYLTGLVTLLGPVARVSATAGRARDSRVIGSGPLAGQSFPVRVATHVAALYEFAGGATATSIFSFDSALPRTQFEVTATDGVLVVPDPNRFGGDLVAHDAADRRTITVPEPRYGRGVGVLELARAIRAGRPERASGALAFHVLDVMVSTLEAAAGGTPVQVTSTVDVAPPLPDDWDPFARTL